LLIFVVELLYEVVSFVWSNFNFDGL